MWRTAIDRRSHLDRGRYPSIGRDGGLRINVSAAGGGGGGRDGKNGLHQHGREPVPSSSRSTRPLLEGRPHDTSGWDRCTSRPCNGAAARGERRARPELALGNAGQVAQGAATRCRGPVRDDQVFYADGRRPECPAVGFIGARCRGSTAGGGEEGRKETGQAQDMRHRVGEDLWLMFDGGEPRSQLREADVRGAPVGLKWLEDASQRRYWGYAR